MPGLLITVRLVLDRYHGASDWPPAPARLFQALVAGAARGRRVDDAACAALGWLESLDPPTVLAPSAREGQALGMFVPNNDLDAVDGDPRRVGEIRVKKTVKPKILPAGAALSYAWTFDADVEPELAGGVARLAEGLYQLGRGVDVAWAEGTVVDDAALAEALAERMAGGVAMYRPALDTMDPGSAGGIALPCPEPGSLASLRARFEAFGVRFRATRVEGKMVTLFTQPPKARFAMVTYAAPPARWVLALMDVATPTRFLPWALARSHDLVTALRDCAFARLSEALPERAAELERVIIGRGEGASAGRRVRFVPLPSVGHPDVDLGIRRVVVEAPRGCGIAADDLTWAVSGIELMGRITTPIEDETMARHFGVDAAERRWRSVTAVVLPERAGRRRIEPGRRTEEAKGGAERVGEEVRAKAAVVQALRHAGVAARAVAVRVQREPFDKRGERAEAFARGSRFAKERLWHVELELDGAVSGPLVIGDGRFLGLGVMRAVCEEVGIAAFAVRGAAGGARPDAVARAVRRAVMGRAADVLGARRRPGSGARGRERLPRFFSGHEEDGAPGGAGHAHLAFVYDAVRSRVLVIEPCELVGDEPSRARARWRDAPWRDALTRALDGLVEVRAGAAGVLLLERVAFEREVDALARPSRTWKSVTPYLVTRHVKASNVTAAIAADVRAECLRGGWPRPEVEVHDVMAGSGRGLEARLRLEFETAQSGPLILGRTRHEGGGVFEASG